MTGKEPHILGGRMQVAIITPEATVFDGKADMVVVPGMDGEVAFLPGHAAYVGLLGVGEVRIHEPEGGNPRFFLAGGVVQVVGNVVSVLAESVQAVANIDAKKAGSDLEDSLAMKATDDVSVAARDRAQAVARAKIRLAGKASGANS